MYITTVLTRHTPRLEYVYHCQKNYYQSVTINEFPSPDIFDLVKFPTLNNSHYRAYILVNFVWFNPRHKDPQINNNISISYVCHKQLHAFAFSPLTLHISEFKIMSSWCAEPSYDKCVIKHLFNGYVHSCRYVNVTYTYITGFCVPYLSENCQQYHSEEQI